MRIERTLAATLVATLGLSLGACGDDLPDVKTDESWLVAIYFAADNNLDPAASADLNELIESGPPDGVEVLFFIDCTEPGKYPVGDVDGLDSFSGARLYRLDSSNVFEMLEDYGEVNSMNVEVVHDFVARAAKTEADRHAIIFWNHGSPTVYGSDETDGGSGLPVQQLRRAFQTNLDDQASGYYHFDILGFDTCLLSSTDAIGALKELADIYVGSAELEPGDGWDYDGLMRSMYDEALTPESFATGIVDSFAQYYRDNPFRTGGLDVTLAAYRMDLDAYFAARTAFEEAFADILESRPDEAYRRTRASVAKSHPYWDANGSGRSPYIDFGNLMANFEDASETPAVVERITELVDELSALRIAYSSADTLPGTIGLNFLVNPTLLADPGRSSGTLQPRGFDDLLAGGDGSVEARLAERDEEAPTVGVTVTGTTSSDGLVRAKVDWTASDDVLLDSVTIMTGTERSDGKVLLGVAKEQNGAVAQLSATGQEEIALAAAGLTGGAAPTPEDAGVALVVGDRCYIPIAWADSDNSGTALLIANKALEIQAVAVQADGQTWSVIVWEDLADHPFELAPLQTVFDPATSEISTTTGTFHSAANVRIEALNLEGDDIVVVGLARDLSDTAASQVVAVP